jgi:hypothetical protein
MYSLVALRIPKVCQWIFLTPTSLYIVKWSLTPVILIAAFGEKVKVYRNAVFLTDPYIDRENLIDAKGTRVAGTCKWITQDGASQSWLHGGIRPLWISGGPCKGKTVMSTFLTKELERVMQNTEGTELLFYSCSHQDEKRNTAITILRGLFYRIIMKYPKLVNHVTILLTPEKVQATLLSLGTLWITSRKLIQDPDFRTTSLTALTDATR